MNKIIIILLFVYNPCYAIFGSAKTPMAEFNAFKMNVGEKMEALVKADVDVNTRFDKIQAELDAKANVSAIAGFNNRLNQVNETVGGNKTTTNESAVVIKMIEENRKMTEKLIGTYQFIINVLIVQLCALLTLFIKKDWDSQRRASDREGKNDDMQMKLIEKALDEEIKENREDKKND